VKKADLHCATLLGSLHRYRQEIRYDDRATQRLLVALLIDRKSLVLNEILSIIHKSLFGEAAAKSDLARSGFVHTVGKTSSSSAISSSLKVLAAKVSHNAHRFSHLHR
jgi:hypothetical protein